GSFRLATAGSVKDKRKDAQELVLRFLAFLVRDYRKYERTIGINRFLSETMVILNAYPDFKSKDLQKIVDREHVNMSDISVDHIQRAEFLFESGMRRSYNIFGWHCFRRSYGNRRRSPINKSLFETWGVLLALLEEEKYHKFLDNRAGLWDDYVPFLDGSDGYRFRNAISRDSMKATAVRYRFEIIEQLIQKHSQ
ncbi:MAG: hypothetical protein AAFW00_28845, partial [Bacteroidota bacterium]